VSKKRNDNKNKKVIEGIKRSLEEIFEKYRKEREAEVKQQKK